MAIEILSPNYILPDNDVWLLKGVPLENNYENTILWQVGVGVNGESITEVDVDSARERQFNYFYSNYNALRLPAMTYLREGRKYVRIDLPYTLAIQYNYMIFKNNGAYAVGQTTSYKYEHRYYYAFISSFEYINDKTTLIHYEIDLMQTYNFDYRVDECLVEREHSQTDNLGEHLLPENLEIGEKISASELKCYARLDEQGSSNIELFNPSDLSIVVCATVYRDANDSIQDSYGGLINGLYTGLNYISFPNTLVGAAGVARLLQDITNAGKESGIVAIFTMPGALASTGLNTLYEGFNPKKYIWTIPIDISPGSTLLREWAYSYVDEGGTLRYKKPNNKKLYSQPFTDLVLYNGNGEIATYGFEYFDTTSYITFNIYSATSPSAEITCVPCNYKNISENFMEKLDISGFPQSAYAIDAYKAWLAQKKVSLPYDAAKTSLNAISMMSFNPTLGLVRGAGDLGAQALDLLKEGKLHEILPPQIKGNQTPYLSISDNEIGYKAYTFRPKDEYAIIIDKYFDLYGYATHKIKVPNRNVRPTWCYTKTIGCRLSPINRGIPADVDDAIRKIYDNGIRFWKNPANIGNYSLSNVV